MDSPSWSHIAQEKTHWLWNTISRNSGPLQIPLPQRTVDELPSSPSQTWKLQNPKANLNVAITRSLKHGAISGTSLLVRREAGSGLVVLFGIVMFGRDLTQNPSLLRARFHCLPFLQYLRQAQFHFYWPWKSLTKDEKSLEIWRNVNYVDIRSWQPDMNWSRNSRRQRRQRRQCWQQDDDETFVKKRAARGPMEARYGLWMPIARCDVWELCDGA